MSRPAKKPAKKPRVGNWAKLGDGARQVVLDKLDALARIQHERGYWFREPYYRAAIAELRRAARGGAR